VGREARDRRSIRPYDISSTFKAIRAAPSDPRGRGGEGATDAVI
jgi:hypothetical protein